MTAKLSLPTATAVTARVIEACRDYPAGFTLNLHTLELEETGYAVGGWVQPFDGFGAMLYWLGKPAGEEFFVSLRKRLEEFWPELLSHGHLGAWARDGEVIIDSVELYRCECEGIGWTRSYAISAGYRNRQDAIGHLCGQFELIQLS